MVKLKQLSLSLVSWGLEATDSVVPVAMDKILLLNYLVMQKAQAEYTFYSFIIKH